MIDLRFCNLRLARQNLRASYNVHIIICNLLNSSTTNHLYKFLIDYIKFKSFCLYEIVILSEFEILKCFIVKQKKHS